jgi:hypothetical protein
MHGLDAALKRHPPSGGYDGHFYDNLSSNGSGCAMDIHAHHSVYGNTGAQFVAETMPSGAIPIQNFVN